MTDLVYLPIEIIHRRPDARQLDDDALAALADSIDTIGLINAIRVRPSGTGYEVVAGAHRFAACGLLGWREIKCTIVADDDLHAELAMIDENLCRAELSPADRARQTARRKAIYLELHPETEHGGNAGGPCGQFVQTANESFAADTAKAIGKDERTVRRDAERGEKVIPEVMELIRGTKLDTGTYLDRIKKYPPNDQVWAAKRDLAHQRSQQAEPRCGAIAARIVSKNTSPTAPAFAFEDLSGILDKLGPLKPSDYIRLCPANKRAAMCQRLGRLADVFHQVMEDVTQ